MMWDEDDIQTSTIRMMQDSDAKMLDPYHILPDQPALRLWRVVVLILWEALVLQYGADTVGGFIAAV